jgi:hypothetical protein
MLESAFTFLTSSNVTLLMYRVRAKYVMQQSSCLTIFEIIIRYRQIIVRMEGNTLLMLALVVLYHDLHP